MSIESSREKWSNKRCPFGVAERCILDECGAWEEHEPTYETETIYKESSKVGAFFSDWDVDEEITESYEVCTDEGGDYREPTYETRYKVVGIRLRKEVTRQTSAGYGTCSRL